MYKSYFFVKLCMLEVMKKISELTFFSFNFNKKVFLFQKVVWPTWAHKVSQVYIRNWMNYTTTSTLGTWRPIVFNVLRCMNND